MKIKNKMAQATSISEANKEIHRKQRNGYVLIDQEVVEHAEGVFSIFLTFEKTHASDNDMKDILSDLTAGLYDLRSVLKDIAEKLDDITLELGDTDE